MPQSKFAPPLRLPERTLAPGLRVVGGIDAVAPAVWDALRPEPDPFTAHEFLEILEASGAATSARGWQPLHMVLGDPAQPEGVVPLYAKAHSWGEYVFDHAWAEAYERAGGRYYPKLQVAVPFTPVVGPRLLAPDQSGKERLIAALEQILLALDVSSLHITFCTSREAELLRAQGWLIRRGIQYHWHNRGYGGFEDFLATLASSRRKAIRRERREVAQSGIAIRTLAGAEVSAADLEAFWPLYLATVDRRHGAAYLTRAFFRLLGVRLRERIVLIGAWHEGRMVAAALNLLGSDTLYGRLWGAREEWRFLHFECCYYRAIEFAIARGLARIEAGAQGIHKLLRGYEPVWTWSAHKFRDAAFAAAVGRFLAREEQQLQQQFTELQSLLPFAQGRS
jgi:predicted N-acyltransferase